MLDHPGDGGATIDPTTEELATIAADAWLHAALDAAYIPANGPLQRIGGGYETDVYCTADRRYVIKLRHDDHGTPAAMRTSARTMRATAAQYAACLGTHHSVPTWYLVAHAALHTAQVVAVQPFIAHAQPLQAVDLAALPPDERAHVATQLEDIVRRTWRCYQRTGTMPDLYGVSISMGPVRVPLWALHRIPRELWSFLVKRTLLQSHNLLLTPERRVVLVDYDLVHRRQHRTFRRMYFAARAVLFYRDLRLIRALHNIVA